MTLRRHCYMLRKGATSFKSGSSVESSWPTHLRQRQGAFMSAMAAKDSNIVWNSWHIPIRYLYFRSRWPLQSINVLRMTNIGPSATAGIRKFETIPKMRTISFLRRLGISWKLHSQTNHEYLGSKNSTMRRKTINSLQKVLLAEWKRHTD